MAFLEFMRLVLWAVQTSTSHNAMRSWELILGQGLKMPHLLSEYTGVKDRTKAKETGSSVDLATHKRESAPAIAGENSIMGTGPHFA